jgi:hypothetical protein
MSHVRSWTSVRQSKTRKWLRMKFVESWLPKTSLQHGVDDVFMISTWFTKIPNQQNSTPKTTGKQCFGYVFTNIECFLEF